MIIGYESEKMLIFMGIGTRTYNGISGLVLRLIAIDFVPTRDTTFTENPILSESKRLSTYFAGSVREQRAHWSCRIIWIPSEP